MKILPMKLILLITFLSVTFTGGSQELISTIKGTVTDKISQSPLIGATVILVNSDPINGTVTDINGEFRLENVPAGRQSIQVSYTGYQTRLIPNLLVLSAKELNLNLTLTEKFETLGEVVISGEADKRESINKMNTVSSRTLSIEEATRFSGSLQDPARMSQNYAGVSGASDDRNDIIIRGNSPTGVLWRMEGIDIPSPNHFSTMGTTGGPVSMLNINNLRNSEFMTGAWSSEYGNALSGVFDLQLREGNNDSYEHLFQVGFNGFELGSEGPLKKGSRSSYLFNYRYSTLGVFKSLGIDLGTGTAIPEYQDLTFKLNFPTKKAGIFSIFGIGGFSAIDFDLDTTSNNLYSDALQETHIKSNTGIIGASHKYFFNENTFIKTVLAASSTKSAGSFLRKDSTAGLLKKRSNWDRVLSAYSLHTSLNKKINVRNSWKLGVISKLNAINFGDSIRRNNTFVQGSDYTGNTLLMQGYFTWRHNFNENFLINIGAQSQYFVLSKSKSFEPRLGLKYDLNPKSKMTFGFGLHSQMQPILTYFLKDRVTNKTPNDNLDFTRAAHYVIGYERNLGKNSRIKAEIYHQYIYNAPVEDTASWFSMLNEGADFTFSNRTNLVNNGRGKNIGLELTLEKFLSSGYYYLVTASIFKSTYNGSDNIIRNTAFNNGYVFNALAGYEFKIGKKGSLTFDTKLTYAGGKPFVPINLDASRLANREVRDYNNAFSKKHIDYFRVDFKVGFRLNSKRITQEWLVDVQNITNRENLFAQGYKVSTGKIQDSFQRKIFPAFLYRLYF